MFLMLQRKSANNNKRMVPMRCSTASLHRAATKGDWAISTTMREWLAPCTFLKFTALSAYLRLSLQQNDYNPYLGFKLDVSERFIDYYTEFRGVLSCKEVTRISSSKYVSERLGPAISGRFSAKCVLSFIFKTANPVMK